MSCINTSFNWRYGDFCWVCRRYSVILLSDPLSFWSASWQQRSFQAGSLQCRPQNLVGLLSKCNVWFIILDLQWRASLMVSNCVLMLLSGKIKLWSDTHHLTMELTNVFKGYTLMSHSALLIILVWHSCNKMIRLGSASNIFSKHYFAEQVMTYYLAGITPSFGENISISQCRTLSETIFMLSF